MAVQIPTVVLPQLGISTSTEAITDLVAHISIDIDCSRLEDKQIYIVATEVITAGIPGNLWCWVELSPYPSSTSALYWAAIGGGGGALVPIAPLIEIPVGVNSTRHTILLPWTMYSAYARLIVWTPVAVGLPNAYWTVQAVFAGRGTL